MRPVDLTLSKPGTAIRQGMNGHAAGTPHEEKYPVRDRPPLRTATVAARPPVSTVVLQELRYDSHDYGL
jgi:hypothetical protein